MGQNYQNVQLLTWIPFIVEIQVFHKTMNLAKYIDFHL